MKFKDPRTGEVFDNIKQGVHTYCDRRRCEECAIHDRGTCYGWPRKHPAEAAKLMGFEIIEDKYLCGTCDRNDGMCYTSNPPKRKCTITGKFHFYDDECDIEETLTGEKNKYHLAEVLGVTEDEVWYYPKFSELYRIHNSIRQYLNDEGIWNNCDNEQQLAEIINHSESIIHSHD